MIDRGGAQVTDLDPKLVLSARAIGYPLDSDGWIQIDGRSWCWDPENSSADSALLRRLLNLRVSFNNKRVAVSVRINGVSHKVVRTGDFSDSTAQLRECVVIVASEIGADSPDPVPDSKRHDRQGCSDERPYNFEAAGSNGCARCTQVKLDQGDEMLLLLKRLVTETSENSVNRLLLRDARGLINRVDYK